MPESKHSDLIERLRGEVSRLRERSEFRTLDTPSGLNLYSNDYLGLATDPRLKRALIEALSRTQSIGATGSRLLSGNSQEWEELESEFANFAGTEAALYFGSGYAANIGLLGSILDPGDVVFSDALNHASLIDGIRLSGATRVIYPHCDLEFLEHSLREHQSVPGARVIVTETLFSMEGDVVPIDQLVCLARKYRAELVVDEAHAVGVMGPQGRGIAAQYGCEGEIFASVYTCGKALASAGAFVCGRSTLRDYLVNRARTFIFSTAMPPYIASQIQAALHLARGMDAERAHLRGIANLLRETLSASGIGFGNSTAHIIPVLLGGNELALRVAATLQANGFAVKAIRPPTVPAGTARLRLSLTSRITVDDIERLAAVTAAAWRFSQQPSAASPAHA